MENMQHAMRLWFTDIAQSINMSYYCKQVGINKGNMSKFLSGSNNVISINKLVELQELIVKDLSKKIA